MKVIPRTPRLKPKPVVKKPGKHVRRIQSHHRNYKKPTSNGAMGDTIACMSFFILVVYFFIH